MMFHENDQIIPVQATIAGAMNKYIFNITKKVKLKPTETDINQLSLWQILDKCKYHQHIVKISSQINDKENLFSFKDVTCEEKLTDCLLKNNERSLSYANPVKILNAFSELLLLYLTALIKYSITTSSFPDKLNLAELMSAFKRVEHFDNYRPISLLSHISKTYKKKHFSTKPLTT